MWGGMGLSVPKDFRRISIFFLFSSAPFLILFLVGCFQDSSAFNDTFSFAMEILKVTSQLSQL